MFYVENLFKLAYFKYLNCQQSCFVVRKKTFIKNPVKMNVGGKYLVKKYLEKYYFKKIIENVILLKVYTNPHIGTNAFIL